MQPDSDKQLETLIGKARSQLPLGEARELGFETRLRSSIREAKEGDLSIEGFGKWCWLLSLVSGSIMLVLSLISLSVINSYSLTGMLASCAEFLPF